MTRTRHAVVLLASVAVTADRAIAATPTPTLTTLAAFNGTNGGGPVGTLAADAAGNLYGTTAGGGAANRGTVFELSGPDHRTLTTLYAFAGADGSAPEAGVTLDAAGNLYGTTSLNGPGGAGEVFELSGPNHATLTVLAPFTPAGGPQQPDGPVTIDAAGNLFATSAAGGNAVTAGTAFELSGPDHKTLATLATFTAATGAPQTGLAADAAGNLYGTTAAGEVFELSGPDHRTLTVLTTAAGYYSLSGPTLAPDGNLYLTSYFGGAARLGAVFELSGPDHKTLTTVASFDGTAGYRPYAGLTADAAGNLFGTATSGPTGPTVYELSGPDHATLTTLATLPASPFAGGGSIGGLFADPAGNLFGVTPYGGVGNNGTVYELTGTGFAPVPEPAAVGLAAAAAGLLCRRRRPTPPADGNK